MNRSGSSSIHHSLYKSHNSSKSEFTRRQPSFYTKSAQDNFEIHTDNASLREQPIQHLQHKSPTITIRDEPQTSSTNNMNEQIDRTLHELKNLMDITAAKLYPVKAQLVAVHNMPDLTAEQETQLLNIFQTQHNPTRVEVGLAAAEVGLTEQQVLSWLSHHFAIWRLTQGLNANEAHVIDVVADRVAHQPPENRRARFSYYCKRTASKDERDDNETASRSMSRNSSFKY